MSELKGAGSIFDKKEIKKPNKSATANWIRHLRRRPQSLSLGVIMKKIIIKLLSGIQIGIGLLFTFLALYNFGFEQIPILSLAILFVLIGLGIFLFKRIAYIAELIILIPVCGLLLFQTGRRITGLCTGIWKESPLAYFLGFITEQIILIPSIIIIIFLSLSRRWYWEQSKIKTR